MIKFNDLFGSNFFGAVNIFNYKRAQVAIEFIAMMIMVFVVIISFLVITLKLSLNTIDDKNSVQIEDLAKSIQLEVLIASSVEPGYHRIFNLPLTISGRDYQISNDHRSVTITSGSDSYSVDIPFVSGNFSKGEQLIVFENNSILIIGV